MCIRDRCTCRPAADNRVVVIRSSYMGEGSEELGKVLIKGFIYALSQQDNPCLLYTSDISKAKNMALADGTVPVGQYTRAALVNSKMVEEMCIRDSMWDMDEKDDVKRVDD